MNLINASPIAFPLLIFSPPYAILKPLMCHFHTHNQVQTNGLPIRPQDLSSVHRFTSSTTALSIVFPSPPSQAWSSSICSLN